MLYRCPPDDRDGRRSRWSRPGTTEPLKGCGHTFEQDAPDAEGFVDCPHCGMFFRPDARDVTLPALTRTEAVEALEWLEASYLERFGDGFRHDQDGDGTPLDPAHPEYDHLGAVIERCHDWIAGQLCLPSLCRTLAPTSRAHARELERRRAAGREAR